MTLLEGKHDAPNKESGTPTGTGIAIAKAFAERAL
jgi:hypothetical protein